MNDKQQLAAMGEHLAEQQPLCMAKRIDELEAQVRVMADLLRETLTYVDGPKWQSLIDDRKAHLFLGRIDAALAGKMPAPVVPEGWQLVQAVPTKDMREAFHEAHEEWESGDDWRLDSPDHQWRAMLAAAPSPEAK